MLPNRDAGAVYKQLIRELGEKSIEQLTQDSGKSKLVLSETGSQMKLLTRAKRAVDCHEHDLSQFERGVLLQYVLDGVEGKVDPEVGLAAAAHEPVPSPSESWASTTQAQLLT